MPLLNKKQNDSRVNNSVHSIIFDRKFYNKQDIPILLKLLGYNNNPIYTTKNFYRVRQFNPGSFRYQPQYITKSSKYYPSIDFIIEY